MKAFNIKENTWCFSLLYKYCIRSFIRLSWYWELDGKWHLYNEMVLICRFSSVILSFSEVNNKSDIRLCSNKSFLSIAKVVLSLLFEFEKQSLAVTDMIAWKKPTFQQQ